MSNSHQFVPQTSCARELTSSIMELASHHKKVAACAVRVENKITFARSFAQKFIIVLLADSARCSALSALQWLHCA